MNRRDFLSAISAGAMGSAFLQFACTQVRDDDPVAAARKLAVDALARAKDHGKPLLVFVVPKDRGIWMPGNLLGAWLAHADDALLADLALFEVVCVPVSALEGSSVRELPSDTEPLMLCVETHQSTPRAIAIDGVVPEELQARATQHEPQLSDEQCIVMDAALHERDELISKWMRDTLKLHERLPELAQQADATLTAAQRDEIAKHRDEPSKLEPALVRRAAAVLRQHAKDGDPASAQAVTRAIATAASAKLKTAAPAGALWARYTGCGEQLDDPIEREKAESAETEREACGMGSVPDSAARFLDFFTNRGR